MIKSNMCCFFRCFFVLLAVLWIRTGLGGVAFPWMGGGGRVRFLMPKREIGMKLSLPVEATISSCRVG